MCCDNQRYSVRTQLQQEQTHILGLMVRGPYGVVGLDLAVASSLAAAE